MTLELRWRSRQTGVPEEGPRSGKGDGNQGRLLGRSGSQRMGWSREDGMRKGRGSIGHAVPLGTTLSQATAFPTAGLLYWPCPLPSDLPMWAPERSGSAQPLHLSSEGPSHSPASHPQHHLSFCLPSTYQGLSCILIH